MLLTNGASRLLGGGRVPWYRAGGAPLPVAAYQPKGAASLAASYVNLVTPGTYDAAPGTAPTFAAATGWTFGGTNQYLTTGITPANGWTLLLLCTTAGTGGGGAGRAIINSDVLTFGIVPYTSGNASWIMNGATVNTNPFVGSTPTVIGFAAKTAYINGAAAGTIGAGNVTEVPLLIGNNASVNRGFNGTFRACAIYNTTLTAGQVAAVSAAMSQL